MGEGAEAECGTEKVIIGDVGDTFDGTKSSLPSAAADIKPALAGGHPITDRPDGRRAPAQLLAPPRVIASTHSV